MQQDINVKTVNFPGPIKMSKVVVTIKIMPEDPSTNLHDVEKDAKDLIKRFGLEVGKVEIEPIAFGLNALKLIFVMDESKGGTEDLEDQLRNIDGVNSVETIDVRRTIG